MCSMQVNIKMGLENRLIQFQMIFWLTAWIGSISASLKYLMVLPGTFFVSFFRPKNVGIAGGSISAISTLACSFVTNLKVYFLT